MRLDNCALRVGDTLYHLLEGSCKVVMVTATGATVQFPDLSLVELSNQTVLSPRGIKLFGLGRPLMVWPSGFSEDLSRFDPIIKEVRLL